MQKKFKCLKFDSDFLCRRKLQQKLKDSDEALSELQTKYSSQEKAKNHMAAELEDVNLDLEKVNEGSYTLQS